MSGLELTPDELLSTTRAVRRRLDLTRPVEREVLEECLRLAQQAPTASYRQHWHFVVVTDAAKRAALGELWSGVARRYLGARRSTDAGGSSARLLASVEDYRDFDRSGVFEEGDIRKGMKSGGAQLPGIKRTEEQAGGDEKQPWGGRRQRAHRGDPS